MANRDLVAVGTSAGGVEALLFLARSLPDVFPAALLVTIHIGNFARSTLDEILSRSGPLPAKFAVDGDPISKGRIYIAPPDRHLIVDGDVLRLGHGARENNTRPSIDPMLRSAAVCCGPRTIGVVLTGTMSDGASGLWALSQCGGISVVQDPADAAFSEMPLSALNRMQPDHVVKLVDLPALLRNLVREPVGKPQPIPKTIKFEVEVARTGNSSMDDMDRIGTRSVLACPECHGVMWEIDEDELVRYRCHVGHTYTAEMMSVGLDENLRRALASAMRVLEERVALAEKLGRQASEGTHRLLAKHWSEKADEFQRELNVIRDSVSRMDEIAANALAPAAAE
jgi:two-component system chemotaxis response regulator CheB